MASADDTFDPNDLDSIDALLDEAELEASDASADSADTDASLDDLGDIGDLDLPDLEESVEPAPEAATEPPAEETQPDTPAEEALPEVAADEPDVALTDEIEEQITQSVAEPELDVPAAAPQKPAEPANKQALVEEPEEEYIPRKPKKTSKNEVSAAEMDALKKLIIIFGSVLIVLVLTAIGMGVWSAIAASGGLDEETMNMIEDIKVGTEKNTLAQSTQGKTVKSVEKKLDALSFQLEQLTADIAALEEAAKSSAASAPTAQPATGAIDPLGLGAKTDTKVAAQPAQMAQAPVAMSPAANQAIMEKLSVVSSKVAKAQKRIDEVNKRVKGIQGQYKKIIHSVKVVEKQVVTKAKEEKEAKAKAAEKAKKKDAYYQYQSPDGMMYDHTNSDSYP